MHCSPSAEAKNLFSLPDLPRLAAGLASVFADKKSTACSVTVTEREPNFYASTFPSEIVTCSLADGTQLKVLSKYGRDSAPNHNDYRGLGYEGAVYRQVLGPLKFSAPLFYGSYSESATGQLWLLLEYLENNVRLNYLDDDQLTCSGVYGDGLTSAVRWLGSFHAANEARLASSELSFLQRYNSDYYDKWIQRTLEFATDLRQRYRWLDPLCRHSEDVVELLMTGPLTVIHGEYTVHNILVRNDKIYPVDWESAAIAAGEIDLASLSEGWPAETIRRCEIEYCRTRWPGPGIGNFERRLDAARLYWNFRWLGKARERTISEKSNWRFKSLQEAGERLGLI